MSLLILEDRSVRIAVMLIIRVEDVIRIPGYCSLEMETIDLRLNFLSIVNVTVRLGLLS
jgi:hypothetical protein